MIGVPDGILAEARITRVKLRTFLLACSLRYTISFPAQSILRADGTSISIPATYPTPATGLLSSHTYFQYWFLAMSGSTGTPTAISAPDTVGSALKAAQCGLDGRIVIGLIKVTTAASGGGGTGGGDVCPEQNELVKIQRDGEELTVTAKEVVIGDYILGHSFVDNTDVWRRVACVFPQPALSWRKVQGHLVSPCEPVYVNGAWTPAFKVGTVEISNSVKVAISVDANEYNEANYYLMGDEQLLIHNLPVNPC